MASEYSKDYLQQLSELKRLFEEGKKWIKKLSPKKAREVHINLAVAHIERLILDTAMYGKKVMWMRNFSYASPISLTKEWDNNLRGYGKAVRKGPNRADHISEECLEDIVDQLKIKFPDINVGIWYSGVEGIDKPRLIVDWR